MEIETSAYAKFDDAVNRAADGLTERAAFETFFESWFPRVYRLASARLADRAAAEAITRATLEAAIREGCAGTGAAAAATLLAIARRELTRAHGAHAFVTRTPRSSR